MGACRDFEIFGGVREFGFGFSPEFLNSRNVLEFIPFCIFTLHSREQIVNACQIGFGQFHFGQFLFFLFRYCLRFLLFFAVNLD